MVPRLSNIHMASEVCEEYVRAKQHRGGLSKDAGSKINCQLEMVYSDVCGPM